MSTDIPDAGDSLHGLAGILLSRRDEPGDESLISALASGDTRAMEVLYDRYSGLLYTLAWRMIADRQIAEDLVQDAFVAVWRHATSYSAQSGTVRNWLVSIMHHRTIDYLRATRRRSSLKETPIENAAVDEQAWFPDVWDEVWRSMQSAQVREALAQIPIEQREVIELAYFRGLTHSEIAERCQLPLGTVKGRIRGGLQHLKRELENRGMILTLS